MFERKQKKGAMVDLSNLPPSQSALYLHMERANYVARLRKLGGVPMLNPPSPIGSGWDENGDIQWIENMLPDEVSSITVITVILRVSTMVRKKLKVKIVITVKIRT